MWITAIFDVLLNATEVHFDILGQDLKYAARAFQRAPGFALTVIAVSALGIGATTATFTMVDHVLIRPLPFPDENTLVEVFEEHDHQHWDGSPANFRDWKRMSTSFSAMGCYHSQSANWIGRDGPRLLTGAAVTADVLPVLGVQPAVGRVFSEADDQTTAAATLVLSYGLWQRDFGGDRNVLGRKMILDQAPYTVIGVMPKDFYFPRREIQFWTPARFGPDSFRDRTDDWVFTVARLKRGVSLERARAEMRTIAAQLEQSYPKEMAHIGAIVQSMRDDVSQQTKLMLMVLLVAALCVLLVACMNVANLLLARAMMRKKELAVRAAMGAGRERLVRQMLTESLILALAGGVGGVALAIFALPLLVHLVPVYLPIAEVPPVDLRVLVFALSLTLTTGVCFGLIPAWRVFRKQDGSGLRDSSRAGGGQRERLRSALVIAEVAGSLVLLVSCGLLIRAMWRIQSVDPGFRPDNVLTLRTSLPMPKYEDPARQQRFVDRVLAETRQLPGVTGAAYISFLPMVTRGGVWPVEVEGHPEEFTKRQNAFLRFVTPGFFSVLGIPLMTGRDVGDSDTRNSQFVAVVSESFVRRYWPGQNPIGHRFNFGNSDRIVVGVVGDVRVRGLERTSDPQVYLPYRQFDKVSTFYAPKDLAVKVSTNSAALAAALQRIIHETDPEEPVSNIRMLSDIVEAETASRRVQVAVLGSFALIAFVLAAIGIHGLLSFAVSNRTQEIGVRMALGAHSHDILWMIVRDGIKLTTIGVFIGACLSYAAGRTLQSLLAGVQPTDMASFVTSVALCFGMTLVGSFIPALRAVRIDPVTAIRAE